MPTRRDRERRAELRARAEADRRRQERRRVLLGGAVLAGTLVVLCGLLWYSLARNGGGDDAPAAKAPVSVTDGTLLVGRPSAPVKVTVYEDLLCPACRQLEMSTRSWLREAAAEGRVSIDYRPFQLLDDAYSARALAAYLTVLQDSTPTATLAFHDALYDDQPYESATDKPSVTALRSTARDAGVSAAAAGSIGGPQADAVRRSQRSAGAAGVQGTPWVLVDGQRVQGSSVEEILTSLRAAVDG